MRQAPPVGVTCSGTGGWRASGAWLAGLAAASVIAWVLLRLELAGRTAAAAAFVGAGLAAWLAWRRSSAPPVDLQWNGQRWRAGDAEVEVDVMLDFGAWMLLRLRHDSGGVTWRAVSSAQAGAAWHPLRAALFARRPRPAADAGES